MQNDPEECGEDGEEEKSPEWKFVNGVVFDVFRERKRVIAGVGRGRQHLDSSSESTSQVI